MKMRLRSAKLLVFYYGCDLTILEPKHGESYSGECKCLTKIEARLNSLSEVAQGVFSQNKS